MEIQKVVWLILISALVVMSIMTYSANHSKWSECPYLIDLLQVVILCSVSVAMIMNILCLMLFRMQIALMLRQLLFAISVSLQLVNIVLCIVEISLVGVTLHSHRDCVNIIQLPIAPYAIVFSIVGSLVYWCIGCSVATMHVIPSQLATFMVAFRPMNGDIVAINDFNGLDQVQISLIATEPIVEDTICSICLENIQIGTLAKVIPRCGHKFHEPCIAPWLANNATCPYCKRSIVFE
jgi:hypothetical protein